MNRQESYELTDREGVSTALRKTGDILVSDMVFCVGYSVFLAQYVLFNTTPLTSHSSFVTLLVVSLMLLKIVLTSVQNRLIDVVSIMVTLLAVILAALTKSNSGTQQLTILVALLFGAKGVRSRTIARVTFWTLAVSVATVLVLMVADYLPNLLYLQGHRIRQSLGFTYVGMLDLYLLHLALLAMFLKGSSLRLSVVAVFLVLHIWAYSRSVVRGTFMVSALVWILFLLFVKEKPSRKLRTILSRASVVSIPLCCFVSFFTALEYRAGQPIWMAVNQLFSERLMLAQLALRNYRITPFGQQVTWVGNSAVQSGRFVASEYNYVDSGYIQVMIQFGVVVLAIACVAYIAIALRFSPTKLDSPILQVWVIVVAIECLIYPNLLLIAYNCLYIIAITELDNPTLRRPAK